MFRINFLQNKNKIIIVGAFLLLLLFMFFSDYGFLKRIELEMKSADLEKEIILQQQTTDSIQGNINKLLNDTLEIERIARENYGMIKPNEKIYYIKK